MKKWKQLPANYIFWGILFCVALLCMWKTQRAVPVMMDDEWYSTVLSGEEPLRSLADIVQAQIWHYRNWGGRTVAHTVLQFILLYLREPVADALNVALIVLLAWMMNVMAGEKRFAFLTLMVGALHGLNANWKMSMYWQTGACNYLYTTVFIFAFLYLYLRQLDDGAKEASSGGKRKELKEAERRKTEYLKREIPVNYVLTPLLGLLAGWTNENMGPVAWLLSLAVILMLLREKRTVRPWMWIGNICCLAGSALMILAPGNSVRSAEIPSNEYGVLWQAFLRMYSVCRGAWEYLFPAILVTAALVWVNVCILGNRLRRREALLLAGALLSWGAMALSPHYPDRAAFGTMCLLLCVAASQAGDILRTKRSRACTMALAGIGVFIWMRGMYFLGEFLAISWGWIR